MEKVSNQKWQAFWENLKQGYDWFELKKIPPYVDYENKLYTFKDAF